MSDRERGLYYNRASAEILAVADNEESPSGSGWKKISDSPSTKLLEARRILVRNGLSEDDAKHVYWRSNEGSASLHQITDEHIRSFKRASDAARERADNERVGIFARLKGLFPGYGRGGEGTKPLT